jgi:hypothetical protein
VDFGGSEANVDLGAEDGARRPSDRAAETFEKGTRRARTALFLCVRGFRASPRGYAARGRLPLSASSEDENFNTQRKEKKKKGS